MLGEKKKFKEEDEGGFVSFFGNLLNHTPPEDFLWKGCS